MQVGGGCCRYLRVLAVLGLVVGCRPPPLAPLPAMGTCSAPLEAPALGAWTAGPSAPTRRTGGLMMTLTGGRVLFAGGRVGGADAPCVTDVELFEPATMAWRKLAPLPIATCGGAAVEFQDGRVLVGAPIPGPLTDWRHGEALFLVYELSTDHWTEVAHAPAPFNLRHLIALSGDEAFARGVDASDEVVGYTVSPRGLVAAAAPARTPDHQLRLVIAGPHRSLTWFFADGSVMNSKTPTEVPAQVTSAPTARILDVTELPSGEILARNLSGWKRWDPDAARWQDAAPLADEAVSATPLGLERVLLISGRGRWDTRANIYTLSSGVRRRIANPHDVDQLFAALPDGRILAVDESGRTTLWSADATMDLAWNRLAPIPQLLPGATVTPLADGRLLVAGGTVGDRQTSSRAILVAPDTGAWSETGAMSTPRTNHTATVLPDGRVLVAGGSDYNRIVDPSYTDSRSEPAAGSYDEAVYDLDTVEIWNPTTGAWSHAGRLSVPLTEHSAVALPDGRVAILGGNASRRVPTRMAGGHWGILYATWKFGGVMVWDPSTKRVTELNAAPRRDGVGTLLLRDGRVLALGGVPEGYEPPPPRPAPGARRAGRDLHSGRHTSRPARRAGRRPTCRRPGAHCRR